MHIPPYHRKRNWQIFALGLLAGVIVAYFIFIFMYGKLYGNTIINLTELEAEVKDLQRQNETLLDDKEKLQLEQILTVKTIDIHFINSKQFRFDRLTTHQLNSLIKDELQHIIGKDVKSIAENSDLMTNLIEKSTFTIDDISYVFTIKKLVISETVVLHLQIRFAT